MSCDENASGNKKWHKKCFVPGCSSNSCEQPSKIFIRLPQSIDIRKQWAEAVGRKGPACHFNPVSSVYCCEDHFNLEADAVDWAKHKRVGGRIKLKPGVIPCNLLRNENEPLHKTVEESQISNSSNVDCQLLQFRRTQPENSDPGSSTSVQNNDMPTMVKVVKHTPSILNRKRKRSPLHEISEVETRDETLDISVESLEPKNRQVNDRNSRCKSRIHVRSKSIQVDINPLMCSKATSPIPIKKLKQSATVINKTSSDTPEIVTSSGSIILSSTEAQSSSPAKCSSDFESDPSEKAKIVKEKSFLYTKIHIENQPRLYTGLPKEVFTFFTECMEKHAGVSYKDLLLTLKKIRTNASFRSLADDFGVTSTIASKIFTDTVCKVASHLKHLIAWSESETIQKNLPIPFRSRYRNVESIIDCFEISIEKPSDPVHQALTWSEYKKSNTLKYLISSTPDGLINYISSGYGGRITDKLIVEISGYLEKLRRGTTVMADRGFKHIEDLLKEKRCTLVRPPTVSASKKSTRAEVKESKRIASLRIHIERVIRRVREFEYLKPHACVNHQFIPLTDYIVIIACAIINLQGPLIK